MKRFGVNVKDTALEPQEKHDKFMNIEVSTRSLTRENHHKCKMNTYM